MSILNFKNKLIRVLSPLGLLVIPLIGMLFSDEMNWKLFDFIVMGALLLIGSIGINFIVDKITSTKMRIILILVILFMFLLIWAELAVGIFGTPFAGD
jgi:succinate dehydrogenase hydrophobic anchor subunit